MSPNVKSHALSAGLIGAGALAWALTGRPLTANADLDVPLNPLGINRSPYGEVFAMAMQTPIDTYFHEVWFGGAGHRAADVEPHEVSTHGHDHDHGEIEPPHPEGSTIDSLQDLLTSLDEAVNTHTNPKPTSQAHKLYLRRQVEDKLRFAYNLDPAHYANYNSLHFFLTEPQLGTRPELTPSAAKLAEETIQYCLQREDDPRPALTAAAAATNILHLMFDDQHQAAPKFTTAQMRQVLGLLDYCIARYRTIANEWDLAQNWERLSPMRIQECDDRFSFIRKIRESAENTILRLEGHAHESQAAN